MRQQQWRRLLSVDVRATDVRELAAMLAQLGPPELASTLQKRADQDPAALLAACLSLMSNNRPEAAASAV
jgi:hypothetical protein